MADQLDFAKHHLEVSKAAVQARVDLMKAYSDYNYRMMQVAELQAKVATDRLEYKRLEDAFKDFRSARKEAKQEQLRAKKEMRRVDREARRMTLLLLGETVPTDMVSRGWSGLSYFVKSSGSEILIEITRIKASKKAKSASNFCRYQYPHLECEAAPGSIRYAWPLLQWARKKRYIPRIGSTAYQLLSKVINVLATSGEELLAERKVDLETAREEHQRIREMPWREMNVDMQEPMRPADN